MAARARDIMACKKNIIFIFMSPFHTINESKSVRGLVMVVHNEWHVHDTIRVHEHVIREITNLV